MSISSRKNPRRTGAVRAACKYAFTGVGADLTSASALERKKITASRPFETGPDNQTKLESTTLFFKKAK